MDWGLKMCSKSKFCCHILKLIISFIKAWGNMQIKVIKVAPSEKFAQNGKINSILAMISCIIKLHI